MIDLVKSVLGVTVEDFDLYIVIISAVALLWTVKMVICGIYNAVLQIFH